MVLGLASFDCTRDVPSDSPPTMPLSTASTPDDSEAPASRGHWRLGVLALYWATLAVATHWPSATPPPTGGWIDKVLHFLAYGGLAWLLIWAWRSRWNASLGQLALGIALLLAGYGAADEITQLLVNRSCELYDWLADLAGIAVGLSVYMAAVKRS